MFQDIFDAIIAGQVDVIIAVFFIGLVMILARRYVSFSSSVSRWLGVSYWIPLIATVILLVAAYFIRSYFTGVP